MILTVTGGKGGVGKSTVAYNLAAELRGVVVDGDLAMADLPASHGPDLHDVLAGRATPHEAVRSSGPVTMIPCGRTLAGARAADPTALADALTELDRAYRWVVVDSPAGLRADVGLPLAVADAAVLVTVPGAAALADALRVRELARELDAGLCRVVLNRAGPDPTTHAIADRFGAPVVPIPDSETLAAAQRHGHPVSEMAPDAPATVAFESLADAVQSCRSV
ncbi:MinD/ParA family ATP-binding protein [Haloarcula amylovorans]|uniref:MinD/ParA family ATP-binding protein n=1 Tax=Haloarcula amylovorans TaxID=2562280 RepID=UPI001075E334|nr:P-loop NTPase [Halomicroarcula amylolytica]